MYNRNCHAVQPGVHQLESLCILTFMKTKQCVNDKLYHHLLVIFDLRYVVVASQQCLLCSAMRSLISAKPSITFQYHKTVIIIKIYYHSLLVSTPRLLIKSTQRGGYRKLGHVTQFQTDISRTNSGSRAGFGALAGSVRQSQINTIEDILSAPSVHHRIIKMATVSD